MKRMIACIVVLLAFSPLLYAQNSITIKGTVLDDSSGTTLSDVTVMHAPSKRGTKTDASGAFTITLPKADRISLTISAVGYAASTVTVTTANASGITVRLKRQVAEAAEDVVVVGYQTMRRRDVLASVSSVGAKELKDIPVNNAAEALNGRLAGVTATTAEGSPDADVRIRVRGGGSITQDNSPLYIIDGVQVENGLQTLSPQDIQTIDVLKDASATAIYGARGANGVIIITTKSGRVGKPHLNYNGFVGIKNLSKKLKVMNPYNFALWEYERAQPSTEDSTNFSEDYVSTFDSLQVFKNVENIDWQEEMMGRTGFQQTHNLSYGGGTPKTTYNISYTYNDDKAIVLNSKFRRHLGNIKVDHKFTSKLKAGLTARLNNTNVWGAGISDNASAAYNRLRNAIKYRPFLWGGQETIDDNDPFAEDNVGNGLNLINPRLVANSEFRRRTTNAYNITANASYQIIKNLNFRSTFGYDKNISTDRRFYDSLSSFSRIQGASNPIVRLDTTTRTTITNSNVLTYSIKNLAKKHDIDVLAGHEVYQVDQETQTSQLRNYPRWTEPTKAFDDLSMGTYFVGYPQLNKAKFTQLSFFGRVNYTFLKRYLFTFNLRADGSSKFAEGKRWGYFPAASVAWRVSQEKFLEDVNWISELKFRASFGTTGNNRIDDYLYMTTFRPAVLYYGLGNVPVPGWSTTYLGNENLKWETTVDQNIGIDFSILKNRFELTLDFYKRTTKDLLLPVQTAPTYGYATQIQNVGQTANTGVDIQLNAQIIRKKDINYSANFNISFNKNEVEKLGPGEVSRLSASWTPTSIPDYILRVGDPVGSMYGWITDGFYTTNDFNYDPATQKYTLKTGSVDMTKITGIPAPGTLKFRDLNGDGIIDDADKTVIGNANPKFTGGLNQMVTYKGWDLSVFVNFAYGNTIYNANKIEFTNAYARNANMLEDMTGRWTTIDNNGVLVQWEENNASYGAAPDVLNALNANATIWRPIRQGGAFHPHSWAMEDGSFIRINNVTLGYTLPIKSVTKIGMSRLRFYLTANNLAVITSYSGYDPEVSVGRNPLTPGIDYSAYPKSRTFIFGINATF